MVLRRVGIVKGECGDFYLFILNYIELVMFFFK